jgi:hypothetical protein
MLCVGLFLVAVITGLSAQKGVDSHYLSLEVANDVFYLPIKTDRYFTSGMQLEYGLIRSASSPLRSLSARKTKFWRIQQDLYTPMDIDSVTLVQKDRPFASYLTLTRGSRYESELVGFTLTRDVTAGVMGKYAGGGKVQNAFHKIVDFAEEVPGWGNEVKPDLVLNYHLGLARNIRLSRRLDFLLQGDGRLGTLFTDASFGWTLSLVPLRLSSSRYVQMRVGANGRLVGYNATLTGGLLNRDERYRGVISPRPLIGRLDFEGLLHYDGWWLTGGVTTISPEFDGGLSHIWAWFGIRFGIR